MQTNHHIIYIPGLSDVGANLLGQTVTMALWQVKYGVSTQVAHIMWANKEDSFSEKLQRVIQAIDAAKERGCTVSIVAASAGASMAVHAFAARPYAIHRVVTIVGAHGSVQHASRATLNSNPALEVSLRQQPAAIEALTAANRGHMLSVKPLADNVIRLTDMDIPGIRYLNLSTRGHLVTIAAALTIHSAKIMSFIKHSA